MARAGQVSAGGDGLRGSGSFPSADYQHGLVYDTHEHRLVVAQLDVETAAVERLARAYAGLARARLEAFDSDLMPRSVAVSEGQLRLVVGS